MNIFLRLPTENLALLSDDTRPAQELFLEDRTQFLVYQRGKAEDDFGGHAQIGFEQVAVQ